MTVHVLEVGVVEAVLAHLLDARLHRVVEGLVWRVGVVVVLRHLHQLPLRLVAGRVVPGEDDARVLPHGERPQAGLAVGTLGVGDLDVGALAVEGPAVEGAADLLALDGAAPSEMGAEVGQYASWQATLPSASRHTTSSVPK